MIGLHTNHANGSTKYVGAKSVYDTWFIHCLQIVILCENVHDQVCKYMYSSPYILRPPMGPRKCGLILPVVLK